MTTASSTPASASSACAILWADPARQQAFEAWLSAQASRHSVRPATLRSASADASFRRYFRVDAPQGSLIIMDAPPDKEDCHPFVAVARLLEAGGVGVPHILEWDEAQGFMLLSAIWGSSTFLSTLEA
jgi:aminoglycoside/choline kinase family phosphotransferase